MTKRFVLIMTALMVFSSVYASGEMFDFYIPWDDSSASATDLSAFISRDVNAEGFLRATADGHLALNSGRVRFWGTNLTFSSDFPDKSYSVQLAAHFAKYGINMVRFHHMDMYAATNGIWQVSAYDRLIDDTQRDKLEYLIYQLKQKGIYADINLLVSRPFNRLSDLPADIDLVTDWKVRAVLGFFDPQLQQLQKDYAQSLLTHVSPYTGLRFVDEPAVGFIEINNENGLIQAYLSNEIDSLPPYYNSELQSMWNAWLKTKYITNDAMVSAWNVTSTAPGPEMITNGDFGTGSLGSQWSLQVIAPAAGSAAVTSDGAGTGYANTAEISVTTPEPANTWHVQFMQGNLSVQTATAYTLTFWAKADSARVMNVNLMQAASPWANLGFSANVNLTSSWQQFTYVFAVNANEPDARVTFSGLASAAGNCWLTGISMKQGGTLGLYAGENLDSGTMDNFMNSAGTVARTDNARKDWFRFLRDTELNYWTTMRDYIKNTLGAHALIFGTIVGCTTPNMAAIFDVVDAHSYWQHPQFPGVAWSATDWFQVNSDMANTMTGTTVGGDAVKRILNKPQAVTEYNHASPNTFAADGYYFLSAYGGLQDWDAVFSFDYGGNNGWDIRKTEDYFSVGQNPAKLGSFIPAALSFIRGDIAPANQQVAASLSNEDEITGLLTASAWGLVDGTTKGMDTRESLVHRTLIAVEGQSVPVGSLSPGSSIPGAVALSDTNQISWDLSTAGKGVISADSARSKFLFGYIGGKTFYMSGVTVVAGSTLQNGFGTLAITAMDGASIAAATKIIVTACGAYENSGQGYYTYPSTPAAFPPAYGINLTSQDQWGAAPSMIEGIPAQVTLPISFPYVSVWSLDSTGARVAAVAVSNSGGFAQFSIAPSYNAMWYEVAVNNPAYSPTMTMTNTPAWTATPTFTITMTPTAPPYDIVDNCENISTSQNLWNGWWYTYRDSLGTVSSGAKQAGGSPLTPGGCFYSSGTLTAGGYCGIGTNLSSGAYVDLSGYLGLRFYVKGDGKQYDVRISTESFIDAGANNYYQYTFTASPAWTYIEIPLASFTQPGGAARPFDYNEAKDILWAADKTYNIYIDDVAFYRQAATPTLTASPIFSPTITASAAYTATFTPVLTATISATITETMTGTPPTVSDTPTATFTSTPMPPSDTATPTITETRSATPTATATETAIQETGGDITDQKPLAYPNPYNCFMYPALNISFSSGEAVKQALVKIYTDSFRLVLDFKDGMSGTGMKNAVIPSSALRLFAPGIYYYIVELTFQDGRTGVSKPSILVMIR